MANYSRSKNALKNLLDKGTTANSNSREEETNLQKLKSGENRSISKKSRNKRKSEAEFEDPKSKI